MWSDFGIFVLVDEPGYDNRLTLQKLEVFCLVVELGSMSRAAERLFVAQPVVTGHVQSLQKRLGVELFYRSGRRLRLTDAGERVFEWARETLARTRALTRELGGLADGEGGGIVVAASTTLGSYVLPEILSRFRERYRGAQISLSVLDPERTVDVVESSECDFAVVATGTPPQSRVLSSERIGADRIVLVASPDFMPGVESISLEDLSDMPLVSLPTSGIRRRVTDNELERHGVRLRNIVMELGHPESMKRAAARGLAEMPSGGTKDSGFGRTRGIDGLRQFTEPKHINWQIS